MGTDRWFGVGSARSACVRAGARAADEALLHDDAKLLVVFCSGAPDLRALVGEIRKRAGDVPLIGCTTAGEIAGTGPNDASVVVAALGGAGFAVETAAATGASADLRQAGARVARCLPTREDLPHKVLMVLSDGFAGNQQEIVRGAHGVLGSAVPLVGGCAGDELSMTETFQFHGDRVLTDSIVAAGIASDAPIGIGVCHGWRRVGGPMLVTASAGNRVSTLDDRPALDVYLERLNVDRFARPSRDGLARLALTHPFGLSRRDGDEVRFISGADFAERSLSCIAEIPQGALVWMMEGDASSVLDATDAACDDALAALDGRRPLGMFAFDCIARRNVLGGEGIRAEIDRLAAAVPRTPVAGFYTYGEIARTRGLRGFHNQTLVVLALG
ncbi:MAG TPA: FIST N-terminal domain-containing protein [Amycolatopsis sp.]|uniref:FIST signal transduction protein n=1 Tax=Amycolatopsis sp. TaxID=37632 RepID=UPI002B475331|nr:FIST N-terminal domain-containing protein [Amycolatopsis sp.]HKS49217.1 FIST N-terminal domain-containing protein [Amycolatopsis sp.]